jgi:putative transposase
MRRGFLYLVAIMNWYSRKVLAWRLSNSMDAEFCIEALKEALAKHGTPEIFNTDSHMMVSSSRVVCSNTDRPHSTHGILTPDEAYASQTETVKLAA